MTLKRIGSIAAGVAVAATSVAMSAGSLPASAAPPQSPGVTLAIAKNPADNDTYVLTVRGVLPMAEGAARDRLNNLAAGGGMDYLVYADDPGENDVRIGSPHGFPGTPGPPGGVLIATPAGLSFIRHFTVPGYQLNEDFCFSSGCGDDTDEIYVFARFVQGNGAGPLGAYTNVVSGKFG